MTMRGSDFLAVVMMFAGITFGNTQAAPDWCDCSIYGDPEVQLFDGQLLVSLIKKDGILTEVGGDICPFKFTYKVEQTLEGKVKVTSIRIHRPNNLLELSEGKTYLNGELLTGYYNPGVDGGFAVQMFGPFTVGNFNGCDARFAWSWMDGSASIGMCTEVASSITHGVCGNCDGVQDDLPDE